MPKSKGKRHPNKKGKRFIEIKKEITKNKSLTTKKILTLLNSFDNFAGCMAEDETQFLRVQSFPSFYIINIDKSILKGSHWIAIGIFQEQIEIFDTLGFRIFNWQHVPCTLLKFLHKLSVTRKVVVSKRIQSQNSNLCGFYCIFYILLRPSKSLNSIQSFFSTNFSTNDLKLINYFN